MEGNVSFHHEVSAEGVDLLALAGELDYATAPRLGRRLEPLMEGGGAQVVLDLTALTFLDSSGLVAVVSGAKLAEQSGGRLAIVSTDRRINRVFEITGLDKVLDIVATPAEATALLATPVRHKLL